jgi:hypothetical protein
MAYGVEKHGFKRTMALMLSRFVTTRIFLYSNIKDNAYCNKPCNLDELKTNVSNTTGDTSPMML